MPSSAERLRFVCHMKQQITGDSSSSLPRPPLLSLLKGSSAQRFCVLACDSDFIWQTEQSSYHHNRPAKIYQECSTSKEEQHRGLEAHFDFRLVGRLRDEHNLGAARGIVPRALLVLEPFKPCLGARSATETHTGRGFASQELILYRDTFHASGHISCINSVQTH